MFENEIENNAMEKVLNNEGEDCKKIEMLNNESERNIRKKFLNNESIIQKVIETSPTDPDENDVESRIKYIDRIERTINFIEGKIENDHLKKENTLNNKIQQANVAKNISTESKYENEDQKDSSFKTTKEIFDKQNYNKKSLEEETIEKLINELEEKKQLLDKTNFKKGICEKEFKNVFEDLYPDIIKEIEKEKDKKDGLEDLKRISISEEEIISALNKIEKTKDN